MNTELKMALDILEKEKDISKEVMLDAIENSLITACKGHFGKDTDNFRVTIDRRHLTFMYMWRRRSWRNRRMM